MLRLSQNISVCIYSVVCRLGISTNLKNFKFYQFGKCGLIDSLSDWSDPNHYMGYKQLATCGMFV